MLKQQIVIVPAALIVIVIITLVEDVGVVRIFVLHIIPSVQCQDVIHISVNAVLQYSPAAEDILVLCVLIQRMDAI
jgi:hypothetical protein